MLKIKRRRLTTEAFTSEMYCFMYCTIKSQEWEGLTTLLPPLRSSLNPLNGQRGVCNHHPWRLIFTLMTSYNRRFIGV